MRELVIDMDAARQSAKDLGHGAGNMFTLDGMNGLVSGDAYMKHKMSADYEHHLECELRRMAGYRDPSGSGNFEDGSERVMAISDEALDSFESDAKLNAKDSDPEKLFEDLQMAYEAGFKAGVEEKQLHLDRKQS
jgi:hypothetical protein